MCSTQVNAPTLRLTVLSTRSQTISDEGRSEPHKKCGIECSWWVKADPFKTSSHHSNQFNHTRKFIDFGSIAWNAVAESIHNEGNQKVHPEQRQDYTGLQSGTPFPTCLWTNRLLPLSFWNLHPSSLCLCRPTSVFLIVWGQI